jgi:hypothetical protein
MTLKRASKIEVSDTESIELGFVRDQEVESSNPFAPTTFLLHSSDYFARFGRLELGINCGEGFRSVKLRQPSLLACIVFAKYVPTQGLLLADSAASDAMREGDAMVLVNVMRIPCFGRRMTIGRASIVWPGAN